MVPPTSPALPQQPATDSLKVALHLVLFRQIAERLSFLLQQLP